MSSPLLSGKTAAVTATAQGIGVTITDLCASVGSRVTGTVPEATGGRLV